LLDGRCKPPHLKFLLSLPYMATTFFENKITEVTPSLWKDGMQVSKRTKLLKLVAECDVLTIAQEDERNRVE
jgi:hypothetical protein